MCVCVRVRRTEAIFQLKRQLVYVVAGVSERKKRKDSKHTNGRDSSSLLQNNPRFPEVRIHSHALAFFTTSSKVKQAVLVPPNKGWPSTLKAPPTLVTHQMGPAWPCQKGCVCRRMQMASNERPPRMDTVVGLNGRRSLYLRDDRRRFS